MAQSEQRKETRGEPVNMKAALIEDDGFMTIHCTAPQPPCPVCHGTGKVAVAGTQNGVDYDTTDDFLIHWHLARASSLRELRYSMAQHGPLHCR